MRWVLMVIGVIVVVLVLAGALMILWDETHERKRKRKGR